MTINDVVKDWKKYDKETEQMFKIMAVNGGQIFPLWGNKFGMYDPVVKLNNNTYYFTPDGLYGFSYKIGRVFKINPAVPKDWKDQIVKYRFDKRN